MDYLLFAINQTINQEPINQSFNRSIIQEEPNHFLTQLYIFCRIYSKQNKHTAVNYIDPVCCVATVCHQVCCTYWGHLGHFHRAISHLKWYKIVCIRYLACIFSQMKSVHMFSMFLQSGVPGHFLWRFIAIWTYNLAVLLFMYVNVDPKP